MSIIDDILKHNREFVQNKQYRSFITDKYPNKKVAILSCMDSRLTELLPAALNIKNGDAKIIKNAGAIISHPFGSVMRSLLVAIYILGIEYVLIIGHTDCGMQGLDAKDLIDKMLKRGIPPQKIESVMGQGIDIYDWLKGFDDVNSSVAASVQLIKNHPLIPKDIHVYGFIMDPITGELSVV